MTRLLPLLLCGCATSPEPVPMPEPVAVVVKDICVEAVDQFVIASGDATKALKDQRLSIEGRATITNTLARAQKYLEDMAWHQKHGTRAEAEQWAACAIAASKLAIEQTKHDSANAHSRPPDYVERL